MHVSIIISISHIHTNMSQIDIIYVACRGQCHHISIGDMMKTNKAKFYAVVAVNNTNSTEYAI